MSLAEVHRTRCHYHPHPRPRDDDRSPRSAEAISAILKAPISPSRRTFTPRASIETDPIEPGPVALSTPSMAKAGSARALHMFVVRPPIRRRIPGLENRTPTAVSIRLAIGSLARNHLQILTKTMPSSTFTG